jgi:predicted acylesterase/phospholipase RssA
VSVIAGGGGGAVNAVLLASAVVPPIVVLLLARVVWLWSKSADTGERVTLRQVVRRALWLDRR